MAIDISGVTLPNVPANVLVRYPSAVILKMTSGDTTVYALLAATNFFGHATKNIISSMEYEEMLGSLGAGRAYYAQADASVWDVGGGEVAAGELMLPVGTVDNATVSLVWANHDVPEITSLNPSTGDYTTDGVYFAQTADTSTGNGNNDASIYRIRRSRLAGIGDQVRRLTEVSPDLTPEEIEAMLAELDITLEEAYVTPTTEQQEIYPSAYGFSKVIVEAVEDSGSSGGGDITGAPAEDTTFGDEYLTETGNYDYSSGTDENPTYIPEIPAAEYRILFSQKLKAGKRFVYSHNGSIRTVTASGDCYFYMVYNSTAKQGLLGLFSSSSFSATSYGSTTVSKESVKSSYADVYYVTLASGGINPEEYAGMPIYYTSDTVIERAACQYAESPPETDGTSFIAFGSATQILYDGTYISNVDGSPMTIYNCNAADTNTWVAAGTTDGNYPVSGYTLVWNSHDTLDMSGQYVTHSKSDAPIAETVVGGDVGTPVERNETYSIEGSTMNSLVSAAQTVTGSKEPLTPTAAASALEEYQSQPAEELTF